MPITRHYSANFGAQNTGLATVGYTLTGGSRETSGVSETPADSGVYGATVTLDAGFKGAIVWDTGGGSPAYAVEDINLTGQDGPTASNANGATAPIYDGLETVYATDEDVADVCGDDWASLAPRAKVLAYGTDGEFADGEPWVLTSDSVDFAAAGVVGRHVVLLHKAAANFARIAGGEIFAIDSVDAGAVTLRRVGLALGAGQAPSPSGGIASVTFEIRTFAKAIEQASWECNKRYGIDPDVPGRKPADATDLRDVRHWTVLRVLVEAYSNATKTQDSDFARKLALRSAELADLSARLSVRWGSQGDDRPPSRGFAGRTTR